MDKNIDFLALSLCCDNNYGIVKYFNGKNEGIIDYGEDNLMPQRLIDLYRKSPTNAGIINRKKSYTSGSNVTFTNEAASMFIDSLDKGAGLNVLFNKLALDYWLYGGFSMQIVWKEYQNEIAKIIYQDYANVRLGYDENEDEAKMKAVVSMDWKANKDIKWVELFDGFKSDEAQIYHFASYTPGMQYYPLPDYYSGLNSIKSEIDLITYQKNIVENGFFPSGILKMPNTLGPEDKEKFKKTIKAEFASAENAGKILTVFADGDQIVEFIPVNNNPDERKVTDYVNDARQSILIAHSLPSGSLIGLPSGASLQGDGNTLAIASKEFYNKIILPAQNIIKNELTYLINKAGYEGSIVVEQNYPIFE